MKELEHETDFPLSRIGELVVRHGGRLDIAEPVLAGCRTIEQPEHVQQRGLAGSGRAHEGDVFTRANSQVNTVQRPNQLVADLERPGQLLQPDQGLR